MSDKTKCSCEWAPGHPVYHCVHQMLADNVEKSRKYLDSLPDSTKQKMLETLRDIIDNPK